VNGSEPLPLNIGINSGLALLTRQKTGRFDSGTTIKHCQSADG